MREVARLGEKNRRDLFRATAQIMGIHEAVIEKDFWVCWVLDYLFQESPWRKHLVFKGGTSLSKVYGAIERFSEDIDLILDWRLLDFGNEDMFTATSATRQQAIGKEANKRAIEFLECKFVPSLGAILSARADAPVKVEVDTHNVFIQYPRAFSLDAIQPSIQLEIGPLAAWLPNEERTIHPYASAHFPEIFRKPNTVVKTIAAERTFWEKATILHQEAHRNPDKVLPPRYSRHYYDLFCLNRMPVRECALAQIELLAEVSAFKMRFYHCPWAKYEEAKPGSLRLSASSYHIKELQRDYRAMAPMFFGEIPAFDIIMAELTELERQINLMSTF